MESLKPLLLTMVLMVSIFASAATNLAVVGLPSVPSDDDNPLANTRWILRSFGEEGRETPIIEGSAITLNFGDDNRADGSGGCNSYGGGYTVKDDEISFIKIISTKRACADDAATRQEARYFEALQTTEDFELAGDKLTIFYNDDENSLNFVKAPSQLSDERRAESAMLHRAGARLNY